jgi:chemotaxis signal transduction protein
MWVLFDAMSVQEVVGTIPALRLPRGHGAIASVVAWRARAIPVVELGAFAHALAQAEERPRMLIVHVGDSVIAVPVDAAAEVVHLDAEQLRAPHATVVDFAVAEADVGEQLMTVIDLNALLRRLVGADGEEQFEDASP